jgi:hypothetical protein
MMTGYCGGREENSSVMRELHDTAPPCTVLEVQLPSVKWSVDAQSARALHTATVPYVEAPFQNLPPTAPVAVNGFQGDFLSVKRNQVQYKI